MSQSAGNVPAIVWLVAKEALPRTLEVAAPALVTQEASQLPHCFTINEEALIARGGFHCN